MSNAPATADERRSLDRLVEQIKDPVFQVLHRRLPETGERPGHVSPEILALSSPRSRYVRRWRRHAARCPACAAVFRYIGLSVG